VRKVKAAERRFFDVKQMSEGQLALALLESIVSGTIRYGTPAYTEIVNHLSNLLASLDRDLHDYYERDDKGIYDYLVEQFDQIIPYGEYIPPTEQHGMPIPAEIREQIYEINNWLGTSHVKPPRAQ